MCWVLLKFWHRSITFNSNKSPTWYNNFSVYYPDIWLSIIVLTCLRSILVSCVDYVDNDFCFAGYWPRVTDISTSYVCLLGLIVLCLAQTCLDYVAVFIFFVPLFADTCPCLFCFFALGVCILGVPWAYFSLFAVAFAGSLLLCMYFVVALSELYYNAPKWHSSCEYLVLTIVLTCGFNICFSNISIITQRYNNIL